MISSPLFPVTLTQPPLTFFPSPVLYRCPVSPAVLSVHSSSPPAPPAGPEWHCALFPTSPARDGWNETRGSSPSRFGYLTHTQNALKSLTWVNFPKWVNSEFKQNNERKAWNLVWERLLLWSVCRWRTFPLRVTAPKSRRLHRKHKQKTVKHFYNIKSIKKKLLFCPYVTDQNTFQSRIVVSFTFPIIFHFTAEHTVQLLYKLPTQTDVYILLSYPATHTHIFKYTAN